MKGSIFDTWLVAATQTGLALAASLISVHLGIFMAMVEIMLGVIGGNFLGFYTGLRF